MLAAVAWCLVGVLPAQDPAPAPAVPKPVQWEIKPATEEWYDADKLAKAVRTVRPLVEKHSGLAFRTDPVVRIPDWESWRRVVAEELPGAKDLGLAVAITHGLYLPDRDEVVLSPVIGQLLLDQKTERAAPAHAILAHELVHVLQQQHFDLIKRMRAEKQREPKWVLRAMSEGFATFVECRIAAAELGLSDYVAANAKVHEKAGRMEYVRGRQFFAVLEAEGGEAAMHAALREPPPTLAAFVKMALKKPVPQKPAEAGK